MYSQWALYHDALVMPSGLDSFKSPNCKIVQKGCFLDFLKKLQCDIGTFWQGQSHVRMCPDLIMDTNSWIEFTSWMKLRLFTIYTPVNPTFIVYFFHVKPCDTFYLSSRPQALWVPTSLRLLLLPYNQLHIYMITWFLKLYDSTHLSQGSWKKTLLRTTALCSDPNVIAKQ